MESSKSAILFTVALFLAMVKGSASQDLSICSYPRCRTPPWSVPVNNDIPIAYFAHNVSGVTTQLQANRSSDADFGLWFMNSGNGYVLCVILHMHRPDNPSRAEVLWTANADRPVSTQGVLHFKSDGDLVLQDQGSVIWSTNSANKDVQEIRLTDRGSLVLLSNVSGGYPAIVWSSFDHPTDTLLLYQTITAGTILTSKSSSSNWTNGHYMMIMQNGGLVLSADLSGNSLFSQPYWIWSYSGMDDTASVAENISSGAIFFALCLDNRTGNYSLDLRLDNPDPARPLLNKWGMLNATKCQNLNPGDRRTQAFQDLKAVPHATFLRLEADGNVTVNCWDGQKYDWTAVFTLFPADSYLPNKCGSYGVWNQSIRQCQGCPKFFRKDSNNSCFWDGSSDTSELIPYQGLSYFSSAYITLPHFSSAQECRQQCEVNTSCMGAFYSVGNKSCNLVNDQIGTLISCGQDVTAYLRINPISSHSKSSPSKLVKILASLAVFIFLALLGGVILWIWFKNRKTQAGLRFSGSSESQEDEMLDVSLSGVGLKRFSYKELDEMTEGFIFKLGQGGSGEVYKGIMSDRTLVAVKKLIKIRDGGGKKEFFSEVAILGRLHHGNLVKLIGFCLERSNRLLVYEFMENGSLDNWLFTKQGNSALNWQTRFQIAMGTAQGMAYMHEECNSRIIHLDLKPQNILLDSKFLPKISDFGLSRLMNEDESVVMTTMKGTPGYLAPEWLMDGAITEKSDVYGFGMVLKEIISGCKSKELPYWSLLESGKLVGSELKVVDPELGSNIDEDQATTMIQLALICTQRDPVLRPSMRAVVQMLEGTIKVPEIKPKVNIVMSAEGDTVCRIKRIELLKYYSDTEDLEEEEGGPKSPLMPRCTNNSFPP